MANKVCDQLDIFGNYIPFEEIINQNRKSQYGGRITKKSQFRSINGFKAGHYCKNCKYFVTIERNKKYFKCEKLGITSSQATDIHKNDIACNLYEHQKKEV